MKLCYPHLKATAASSPGYLAAMRWDAANYGGYASIKEPCDCLSRAAACEWAKDGIRTNVIVPLAHSPALDAWIKNFSAEAEAFIATVPQQRIGDAEQDAAALS